MIPEMAFKEMKNSGRSAMCCGNCGFINCDAYSKQIQVQRLQEARATRSDLLITACPKCMIHLTCAIRDPFAGVDVHGDPGSGQRSGRSDRMVQR